MDTSAAPDPDVLVEGLSVVFGQQTALADVDLELPSGSLVGIVGPNGSGKSTLLACVVGMLAPTRGRVLIGGSPAGSDAARAQLTFTPDDLPLPDLLTGGEFLELVADLEQRPDGTGRAVELARAFGISDALGKLVGSYSHGMRRRLQFAAAFSSEASIAVLDEPFSGLDVEGVYLLRVALREWLGDGGTAVISIHDLSVAERECDHVVVLAEGRVVAAGAPQSLLHVSPGVGLEELVLRLSGAYDTTRSNARDIRAVISGDADRLP